MTARTPYSIHTDVKFNPLELIDVQRLQKENREQWFNQTLCQVNDCALDGMRADNAWTLDQQQSICEIPAPPFGEARRAEECAGASSASVSPMRASTPKAT